MTSSPAPTLPCPRTRWLAAAVCAAAGIALFQFFGNASRGYIHTSSLFYWWCSQWWNPASELEHAWLVLAISAWLLWRNLRISDSNPQSGIRDPQWPAFVALVTGLALHVAGFVAQQSRISIVALLVFTWGALRLGGGRRWGTAALFPLGFLLFAIPVDVLDSLGFWLRMWVVNASTHVAHLVGIGVLQNGTQLVAPDGRYNYDVAAACSGIRSLTALTALSLLAAYLNFHSWWRRLVVLFLCFPLVYLGNLARILAIIVAAQLGGPKWGDIAHEAMGFGVFVIVLGGALLAIAALQRWWPQPAISDSGSRMAGGEEPDTGNRIPDSLKRRSSNPESVTRNPQFIAAGVVLIAIAEIFFLRHLSSLPPAGGAGIRLAADGQSPVDLPAFVGGDWAGQRAAVTAFERELLPPDTGYARRTYINLSHPTEQVFFSVVLSGRDRSSIHRPEICLVGQGWTIADRTTYEFKGLAGQPLPVSLLRVRRVQTPNGAGADRRPPVQTPQLVAYWFVSADRIVATHWGRFALDTWNRVAHGRADRWAYVLVQTDARDGEPAALRRIQAILDGTLPALLPAGGAKPATGLHQ